MLEISKLTKIHKLQPRGGKTVFSLRSGGGGKPAGARIFLEGGETLGWMLQEQSEKLKFSHCRAEDLQPPSARDLVLKSPIHFLLKGVYPDVSVICFFLYKKNRSLNRM